MEVKAKTVIIVATVMIGAIIALTAIVIYEKKKHKDYIKSNCTQSRQYVISYVGPITPVYDFSNFKEVE